ncbi:MULTISPECIES: WXG100 family type VII secretion target [unclassified Solwaraspora]|uniref:WXG100 family type VII secretion target n=1 Tax=unclassified Solwaraspora TaxID=2627926 RepID=UPI00259B756F|nr:WXG100 family type VII secretion target [Solwaraspora sp. WMMA2056]WJK42003.1 WXG100 family type VII secretion target [Solwaraspora sp. WMMA2056]
MSQTQVDPAAMQQVAARFEQTDEELQAMLRGLLQRLESVRSAWRGAGGRSFEQVKTAWAQEQAALHRALRETAGAVRGAGVHYRGTDTAAADRVAAVARRIELPL